MDSVPVPTPVGGQAVTAEPASLGSLAPTCRFCLCTEFRPLFLSPWLAQGPPFHGTAALGCCSRRVPDALAVASALSQARGQVLPPGIRPVSPPAAALSDSGSGRGPVRSDVVEDRTGPQERCFVCI